MGIFVRVKPGCYMNVISTTYIYPMKFTTLNVPSGIPKNIFVFSNNSALIAPYSSHSKFYGHSYPKGFISIIFFVALTSL